jgi:hypothetical protein
VRYVKRWMIAQTLELSYINALRKERASMVCTKRYRRYFAKSSIQLSSEAYPGIFVRVCNAIHGMIPIAYLTAPSDARSSLHVNHHNEPPPSASTPAIQPNPNTPPTISQRPPPPPPPPPQTPNSDPQTAQTTPPHLPP